MEIKPLAVARVMQVDNSIVIDRYNLVRFWTLGMRSRLELLVACLKSGQRGICMQGKVWRYQILKK